MKQSSNRALLPAKSQGRGIGALESREAKTCKELCKMVRMYLQGISISEIAKATGTPRSTVHHRLNPFIKIYEQLLPELLELRTLKAIKGELFQAAQLKMLRSAMDSDRIEKATINQLAYATKIFFDIAQKEKQIEGHHTLAGSYSFASCSSPSMPPFDVTDR